MKALDENMFRWMYKHCPKVGTVYYIFRQPLVILASLVIEVVLVPVVGLVYFITELCKGWAYAVGEASERFCSYGHNIYSIERLWRGEAKK